MCAGSDLGAALRCLEMAKPCLFQDSGRGWPRCAALKSCPDMQANVANSEHLKVNHCLCKPFGLAVSKTSFACRAFADLKPVCSIEVNN